MCTAHTEPAAVAGRNPSKREVTPLREAMTRSESEERRRLASLGMTVLELKVRRARFAEDLFGGDEGAVAGDAAPDAVAADPGVGVAGADDVFFAFVGAGLAVDAVDDGGVAVDVDGHAFVEEVIGFLFGGGDPLQVFGFVHDGAVVVGVDEGVVDEVGDFFDLLIGFGLVPGAFELADLDFVGVRCFSCAKDAEEKRSASVRRRRRFMV